ncbi:MAG: HNH endonuclease [Phycisphaeraceae bacterium]|nr:HNH endonuclease [Phycisphaeraceae bacterium]
MEGSGAGKGDSYRKVDAEKFAEGDSLAFPRKIMARLSTGGYIEVFIDSDSPIRDDGWKINADGYCYRDTNGFPLLLHRFLTGAQSGEVVDHINGDRLDNRSGNLRKVTAQANAQNLTCLKRNNTSGYRGVSYDKAAGRWYGSVKHDGKHYKKRFDSKEKAALWAAEKRRELGFTGSESPAPIPPA